MTNLPIINTKIIKS